MEETKRQYIETQQDGANDLERTVSNKKIYGIEAVRRISDIAARLQQAHGEEGGGLTTSDLVEVLTSTGLREDLVQKAIGIYHDEQKQEAEQEPGFWKDLWDRFFPKKDVVQKEIKDTNRIFDFLKLYTPKIGYNPGWFIDEPSYEQASTCYDYFIKAGFGINECMNLLRQLIDNSAEHRKEKSVLVHASPGDRYESSFQYIIREAGRIIEAVSQKKLSVENTGGLVKAIGPMRPEDNSFGHYLDRIISEINKL